ncbi:MAG: sugar ABC transporter ATP-binding protein [bacterium]|nr:sugar ABC transporter ATP-binding protein [bacterium]
MSAFSNMVANDINNVFMNLDEFGEKHIVDGNEITIILDEDAYRKANSGIEMAVGEVSTMIYGKVADLPKRKGYGAGLTVDGREYSVNTWDEDMGMATISLFVAINV